MCVCIYIHIYIYIYISWGLISRRHARRTRGEVAKGDVRKVA